MMPRSSVAGQSILVTGGAGFIGSHLVDRLLCDGATHVIVHEAAYLDAEGRDTTAALQSLGATEVFRDGPDTLLALP